MFWKSILVFLVVVILATGCDNHSIHSNVSQSIDSSNTPLPAEEAVDRLFDDFINKFSSDTAFQLSRTAFPLKTIWYDLDNDNDSIIYIEKTEYQILDFRKKKSNGDFDNWEQKRVTDTNSNSATITIKGIENGIFIEYRFDKRNGCWMLVEISDQST